MYNDKSNNSFLSKRLRQKDFPNGNLVFTGMFKVIIICSI